jgi:hypothetical protein
VCAIWVGELANVAGRNGRHLTHDLNRMSTGVMDRNERSFADSRLYLRVLQPAMGNNPTVFTFVANDPD